MNRAARLVIVLISLIAIGVLSAAAGLPTWKYFAILFVVWLLGEIYIGEEE